MEHRNIILIGFMGTGKSTVAGYLSGMLNYSTVETDAVIEKNEHMPISEIFRQYGEDYFRSCETKVLMELINHKGLVVSSGGGIVTREENIRHIKKIGLAVLLNATPDTVYERVKNSSIRPLLADNMSVSYISGLMEKRKGAYLKAANIVVDTDCKTPREICEELISALT